MATIMLLMDGHDLSNHYAIPIDCLSAPVLMIATLPNGELSLPPPLQPIVRMSTMAGKGGSLSGPSPPPPLLSTIPHALLQKNE